MSPWTFWKSVFRAWVGNARVFQHTIRGGDQLRLFAHRELKSISRLHGAGKLSPAAGRARNYFPPPESAC
jgi:hypothetical protein